MREIQFMELEMDGLRPRCLEGMVVDVGEAGDGRGLLVRRE